MLTGTTSWVLVYLAQSEWELREVLVKNLRSRWSLTDRKQGKKYVSLWETVLFYICANPVNTCLGVSVFSSGANALEV